MREGAMKKVCYVGLRDFRVGDTLAMEASVDLIESLIGEHIKILYEKENENVGNSWMRDRNVPVDLVVHAGGNEWAGFDDLEECCIADNVPVIYLGVGTGSRSFNGTTKKMFRACKVLMLGRDHIATESAQRLGGEVYKLTCPSLFYYRSVDSGDRLGIVFQSNRCREKAHCIRSEKIYKQSLGFIQDRLKENPMLICHYIDDYLDLYNRFPESSKDLRYSTRIEDYIKWYSQCGVIYSTRLHGVMLAASLGKPTVGLKAGVKKMCAFDHLPINVVEPAKVSCKDLSNPEQVNAIKQSMAKEFNDKLSVFLNKNLL